MQLFVVPKIKQNFDLFFQHIDLRVHFSKHDNETNKGDEHRPRRTCEFNDAHEITISPCATSNGPITWRAYYPERYAVRNNSFFELYPSHS